MFFSRCLFAYALLTAPGEECPTPPDPEVLAHLAADVKQWAIQLDIMDRQEARYLLCRPDDYRTDFAILHSRYHDLLDAPPVFDAQNFPTRAIIDEFLGHNRAYRAHIHERKLIELVRAHELEEILQETDRLYEMWDTLREARREYYHVYVRRKALKKLRTLIGEEAYYTATLPPHVPLWRFSRID